MCVIQFRSLVVALILHKQITYLLYNIVSISSDFCFCSEDDNSISLGWIMTSVLFHWYQPGGVLLVRCICKGFFKFPLVHKSCKIQVEISLAFIHSLSSREYTYQRTLHCRIPVFGVCRYSMNFSTLQLSWETGPGFAS